MEHPPVDFRWDGHGTRSRSTAASEGGCPLDVDGAVRFQYMYVQREFLYLLAGSEKRSTTCRRFLPTLD